MVSRYNQTITKMNCPSFQKRLLRLVIFSALAAFVWEQNYLGGNEVTSSSFPPLLKEIGSNLRSSTYESGNKSLKLSEHVGRKGRTLSSQQLEKANRCEEQRSGAVTISNENFVYCFPPSLVNITRSSESDPVIIVGVLTAASNRYRRNIIRETWAQGHKVFFLVGGDLEGALAEEFLTFGDIVWFDGADDYKSLTFKTQMFLHVVHTHVNDYDYIFKTDDDSFLNVAMTEKMLAEKKPEYYGFCIHGMPVIREPKHHPNFVSKAMYSPDTYPPYSSGAGYALSKTFNACLVSKLPSVKFITNEDAGLGIIAKECNVECTTENMIKPWKSQSLSIYEGVTRVDDMRFLHKVAVGK